MKSKIQNPLYEIQNPKSKIHYMKSKIQNPKSKIIILLLIFSLILPSFRPVQAVEQPQTVEGAKGLSMKILTALPDATKKVWREEAWPFILRMRDWAQGPWNNYIKPQIEIWWQKFLDLLGKETPADLKEEFQKEREEMEQDLWQRFKELLK